MRTRVQGRLEDTQRALSRRLHLAPLRRRHPPQRPRISHGTDRCRFRPHFRQTECQAMNKPTRNSELTLPKVTTGPLPASAKVYSAPDGLPDVRVPLREITLTEKSGEAPFRAYDPSGPYTDAAAAIDVTRGLPRVREAWIKGRGGVEQYVGREVRPEDNGNVSPSHLARDFAEKPQPFRGLAGQPVTQLEYARAGIVTKEMAYVAHRENLGRVAVLARAQRDPRPRRRARRRASGAQGRRELGRRDPAAHHARVRALRDRPRPRH